MKKKYIAMLGLLCLFGLWMLAGCNKKANPNGEISASSENAQPTPIDPNTVASLSGMVKFDGVPPKMPVIDMSQDPACKGVNDAETIAVNNGSLANVFVYVKDGLGNRTFTIPTEAATVNQSGCKYNPHVLGVMTGQKVEIKNDDMTEHNVHSVPTDNPEWNISQPPQASPLVESFPHQEIMLPIKCNQHPWMKMYINVVKSPFYAVTAPDGKYEIKGLPPGDYTIAFVQEKLGEQDQKVTLAAKENKVMDIRFKQ